MVNILFSLFFFFVFVNGSDSDITYLHLFAITVTLVHIFLCPLFQCDILNNCSILSVKVIHPVHLQFLFDDVISAVKLLRPSKSL